MKSLGLVVFCAIAATAMAGMSREEKLAIFQPIADECAAETGATKDDIEVVIKHQPASNKETKCFRACVMKKAEVMNGDGKLVKEPTMKFTGFVTAIDDDDEKMKIAEEIIGHCAEIPVPDDDHCEAAEEYKKCLIAGVKEHGFELAI